MTEQENNTGLRIDIGGVKESVWTSNGLTYQDHESAKKYLDNLADRWFGFDIARIVPASTPRGEIISQDDTTIVLNYRK